MILDMATYLSLHTLFGFKATCDESLHGNAVRAAGSAVGRGMASLVVLAICIRDARFAFMGAQYVEAP